MPSTCVYYVWLSSSMSDKALQFPAGRDSWWMQILHSWIHWGMNKITDILSAFISNIFSWLCVLAIFFLKESFKESHHNYMHYDASINEIEIGLSLSEITKIGLVCSTHGMLPWKKKSGDRATRNQWPFHGLMWDGKHFGLMCASHPDHRPNY